MSARDWITFLRTGQPPTGYDALDAWTTLGCAGLLGIAAIAVLALIIVVLL